MSARLRFVSAAFIAVFLAGIFPIPVSAFTDVSASYDYKEAIENLRSKGVITGYEDGTFKPSLTINRAEFLAILLRARSQEIVAKSNCFPDVREEWFASIVCTAKEEGIVSGYPGGTFGPGNQITFVEAGKILSLAYKQNVSAGAGDYWYEPYAMALEGARAIPPSVKKLDAPIVRGEMAEMMWRLSEGKEDLPSKGYLNLKYPSMQVDMSSKTPVVAKSCEDLKAFTDRATSGVPAYYGSPVRMMMQEDAALGAPQSMDRAKSTTGGSSGTRDHSTTNVQVEGVDEGDVVKTDGSYAYVLSRIDGKIRIVDIRNIAKMIVVSEISSKYFTASELYIEGDTLIAVGQKYEIIPQPTPMTKMDSRMMYPPTSQTQKTTVKIFDVSARSSPKEKRSVSFEGSVLSTRLVDGKLLAVLNAGPRWFGPYMQTKKASSEALIPVFDDTAIGATDQPVVDCNKVVILPRVPSPQYLIVATVPLNTNAAVGRSVILGNGQNVYASLQNLYIASPEWLYSWRGISPGGSTEKTNIFKFGYTGAGVEFRAQGSVPGHILNQFSMDESGDLFRIAVTESQSWNPSDGSVKKSTNGLHVLNANLEVIGSVDGIAPGESIFSVRFMGKRAYMVTFKQVDPLFVIDLSSPRNPKILGELKIPGYSNYLHPVDENHLIGFGKEVDESIDADKVHSDDAVYYTAVLGMKMSLFDVSNVARPVEKYKVVIGDRGTESPLLSDHKALFYDADRGVLSFPVTVHKKNTAPQNPTNWAPETFPVFQGAYVYSFSKESGFKELGRITHHSPDDFNQGKGYWYSNGGFDISRILRVGSSLLTLSEGRLAAHALPALTELGIVKLSDVASQDGTGYTNPMPIIME